MVASSNTWNLPVSSNTSTRLPHPPARGGSGLSSRCSTGGPRGRPKGFGQQFREQNERRKSEAPAPGFFFLRVEVILPDANGVFHELNRLNNIQSSAGRVGINTVTVNRFVVRVRILSMIPTIKLSRISTKLRKAFNLLLLSHTLQSYDVSNLFKALATYYYIDELQKMSKFSGKAKANSKSIYLLCRHIIVLVSIS